MKNDITGEEISTVMIPMIEQQIQSPDTPYVKAQFERLLTEGEEETEAKRLIALCLADEIAQMQQEDRPFDAARYEHMLQFLPILPE